MCTPAAWEPHTNPQAYAANTSLTEPSPCPVVLTYICLMADDIKNPLRHLCGHLCIFFENYPDSFHISNWVICLFIIDLSITLIFKYYVELFCCYFVLFCCPGYPGTHPCGICLHSWQRAYIQIKINLVF